MTRMAKSDGIIVMSRAAPLRKTTTKVMKMMATVMPKLSTSVGTRFWLILAWRGPRPTVCIVMPFISGVVATIASHFWRMRASRRWKASCSVALLTTARWSWVRPAGSTNCLIVGSCAARWSNVSPSSSSPSGSVGNLSPCPPM